MSLVGLGNALSSYLRSIIKDRLASGSVHASSVPSSWSLHKQSSHDARDATVFADSTCRKIKLGFNEPSRMSGLRPCAVGQDEPHAPQESPRTRDWPIFPACLCKRRDGLLSFLCTTVSGAGFGVCLPPSSATNSLIQSLPRPPSDCAGAERVSTRCLARERI